MLNVKNGSVLVSPQLALQPLTHLDKFKEFSEFANWNVWVWNDEKQHICYTNELSYKKLDSTVRLHFIDQILLVTDLIFLFKDQRPAEDNANIVAFKSILNKNTIEPMYHFEWGLLTFTRDEFGSSIARVNYE